VPTLHLPDMNKTPITINPDWLEFILIGQIKDSKRDGEYIELPANFVLKELGYGTKHFCFNYEVYYEGLLFGTLRTEPRNDKIMDANWQQFKIENERLYEKGYIELCSKLFASLGSSVRNISRLDIAADGFGFMDLMKRYDSGKIDKRGKAKYTLYKDNQRKIEGFDIGSKKSDKAITGYLKSEEIEKSNKHYIKEFWKRSGLPNWDNGEVERLEIRLKNNAIVKIENFDWERLENPEYLAGVMRKHFENYFDFHSPNCSNISRARKIEFINWDLISAERLEFATARKSTEYNRLKQNAKTMFWLYLGTGKRHYLQICREIVENINCLGWFIDKQDFWKREFRKQNKKGNFDYIPVWKQLKGNEQLKLTENFYFVGKLESKNS